MPAPSAPLPSSDDAPASTCRSCGSGEYGAVETKVRSDLDSLVTIHPMGEALAAMSINLARTLDEGAGLAVAAVNRELRANLVELARMEEGDDDLGDDLSTPSSGSASLRDPSDS